MYVVTYISEFFSRLVLGEIGNKHNVNIIAYLSYIAFLIDLKGAKIEAFSQVNSLLR